VDLESFPSGFTLTPSHTFLHHQNLFKIFQMCHDLNHWKTWWSSTKRWSHASWEIKADNFVCTCG